MSRAPQRARRGHGNVPPPLLALGLAAGLVIVACTAGGPTAGVDPSSPPLSRPGPSAAPAPASTRQATIVDTDLDADDLRAIAYLSARPDVDLIAVTVAGTGIVRCPAGATIARALLARLGKGDTPVACGRSTAVSPTAAFPSTWRDRADQALGLDLASGGPRTGAIDATAVDVLTSALDAARSPVHLLVLGPATNIADLLAARPDLAIRIGTLTMMGGALKAAGNVAGVGVADDNRTAEWNVFADPAAWQAVLDADLEPTIVPLDATNAVPVTADDLALVAANRAGPAGRVVFDLLDADPTLLASGQSYWDSLTAVAAFVPGIVTTRPATVRVELTPGAEIGRLVEAAGGARATVATAADPGAFRSSFLSTLNGGAPARAVPDAGLVIHIAFDGQTCTTDAPTSIPNGFVAVAFTNSGAGEAGGGLFGLDEGVTPEALVAALRSDPDSGATLGRVVVGTAAGAHGSSDRVGFAGRPGNAVVGCIGYTPAPAFVLASGGPVRIEP